MKIAIVTFFFEPIKNPRSFRATELAKGLANTGHEVTVYNGSKKIGFSYDEIDRDFKLINLDSYVVAENIVKGKKSRNIISRLGYYFTTGNLLKVFIDIKRKLSFEQKYDVLISIGLPFHIHWAVGTKIKGRNIANTYIADYGDPFSKNNPVIEIASYFRLIEKRIIKKFDYITVPTDKSVQSYTWLKKNNKIKVIPQGFDFTNIKLSAYKKNEIPTFCYAGLFYRSIRNPSVLLDFLSTLDSDFRFYIFTSEASADSFSLIESYKEVLGQKLIISDFLSRENLLLELSKMDFLVNINNISKSQTPSKLIDYGLAKRPIYSFDQLTFDKNIFMSFLDGDYTHSTDVDIDQFDIRNVVKKFEEIF